MAKLIILCCLVALCQAGKLLPAIVPAVNFISSAVPSVELQAPNPSYRSHQGFEHYGLPSTADRGTQFAPNGNAILSTSIPGKFMVVSVAPNLPSLPNVPVLSSVLSLPHVSNAVDLPILSERPSVPARPNIPIPHISSPTNRPIGSTGTITLPQNSLISIIDDKNQYTNGFSLDDGTKVAEQGQLISTDNGWEYVIAKKGSYEYVSPDGTPVKVKWIADENGFRHV